jgi:hypothetical protein
VPARDDRDDDESLEERDVSIDRLVHDLAEDERDHEVERRRITDRALAEESQDHEQEHVEVATSFLGMTHVTRGEFREPATLLERTLRSTVISATSASVRP